jgi:hypothetical protein
VDPAHNGIVAWLIFPFSLALKKPGDKLHGDSASKKTNSVRESGARLSPGSPKFEAGPLAISSAEVPHSL